MDYTDKETLGQAVKAWREDHHYRMGDAAKVANIPYASFQRIEYDQGTPRIKNLALIAKTLGMSTDEVIMRWFNDDKQKDQ
ncbi:helix-turn-helix transcriptional regulator [Weissella paramesenteroides]|uniref:helix-turn-helix domain-containing protein n=1 Tax=Weissella paramesenteroides TaxID=1249 RepID=UPI003F25D973